MTTRLKNGWNKEHLRISQPEPQSISMGNKNEFFDTRRGVESNYQVNHFPKIKSTSIILKQPQLVENVQTMLSDN